MTERAEGKAHGDRESRGNGPQCDRERRGKAHRVTERAEERPTE